MMSRDGMAHYPISGRHSVESLKSWDSLYTITPIPPIKIGCEIHILTMQGLVYDTVNSLYVTYDGSLYYGTSTYGFSHEQNVVKRCKGNHVL
jgi:hypothetical protein